MRNSRVVTVLDLDVIDYGCLTRGGGSLSWWRLDLRQAASLRLFLSIVDTTDLPLATLSFQMNLGSESSGVLPCRRRGGPNNYELCQIFLVSPQQCFPMLNLPYYLEVMTKVILPTDFI